jgi:uncharacterized protein YjaG (DUF416 family)
VGEEIGFIARIASDQIRYKIISRAKKTNTRVEEIKKRWIDFRIAKDKEKRKEDLLRKLQEEFKEKRSRRKTLSDFA